MKAGIVSFITVVMFSSCAFGTQVPEAVKTAFHQKFPTVLNEKWGKEGKSEYEAEFQLNGKSMSANFSENGTWVETETAISAEEIPTAVSDAVKAKFPDKKILSGEINENPKRGMIYEVIVKGKGGKEELVVTADGTSVTEDKDEE